jgi:hypothetical protein
VAADRDLADRLLADAALHLATASAALAGGDLAGAYQLAYDALRKSCAALLAVQGLRATSRGGHVAVQEAVQAQFGSTVTAVRAFGRIRRARHRFEYPDRDTAGPSTDDVRDAVDTATAVRHAVMMIVDQNVLDPW